MSENFLEHGPHLHAHSAPTTQQMRTVGQRRRDAEEKLEQHLQEARHKDPLHAGQLPVQDAGDAADPNAGR